MDLVFELLDLLIEFEQRMLVSAKTDLASELGRTQGIGMVKYTEKQKLDAVDAEETRT